MTWRSFLGCVHCVRSPHGFSHGTYHDTIRKSEKLLSRFPGRQVGPSHGRLQRHWLHVRPPVAKGSMASKMDFLEKSQMAAQKCEISGGFFPPPVKKSVTKDNAAARIN